jgi:hypothetical protein
MDNFTLAVIVADIFMLFAFVTIILMDKPRQTVPTEPGKPAGKRPA